jgi:hypothetical protein
MNKLAALLFVALASGCTQVVKPIDFSFALDSAGRRPIPTVFGTAADDLWALTYDGKDAQDDSFDLYVRYWDGTSDKEVPVSKELFRDGACGKVESYAAVNKGEAWLASHYAPGCGLGGNATDRLIFGRLKSDGTWEDRSGDFPVSAPGTYTSVKLTGREGVLYVTVTYGASSATRKTFRYAGGAHAEFSGPAGAALSDVHVLGPDDVLTADAYPKVMRHVMGEWKEITGLSATQLGGLFSVRGKGEAWGFVRNLHFANDEPLVAYRDDGANFTEVIVQPVDESKNLTAALAVIPRGSGRLTVLFAPPEHRGGQIPLSAGEFDGSTLSMPHTVASSVKCEGTADECMAAGPTLTAVLEDGNFLVTTGRWTSVVLADQL